METDWREILKFSQRELKQAEKEKLCESLSWMETDDIELNFSDLKTLFRLAQDIIKYKTEQINGVLGKLEKSKRKNRTKEKSTITDSPAVSADSVFDTITHQEEVIKANKDILEQLYADIAELEQRKTQYDGDKNKDQESESSRGTLSELNAIAQLENEVSKRNRHIRKLLGDVKILEEENTTIKEKLTIFKNKLREATLLIENLTEQLFTFNTEHTKLKELLARMEEEKANLVVKIETLKNELNQNNLINEKTEEDLKSKLQHLKELVKSYKSKIDALSAENSQLKEEMIQRPKVDVSPKKIKLEEIKVKELQEKLIEASEEMVKSANLIQALKEENRCLKSVLEDIPDNSLSEHKNESDDGKEKNLIKKLKRKAKSLNLALQGAEEMVAVREKELTEITAQLRLLRSDEGVNALIEGIKNKKRHLKIKDEGIKSLVQDVNTLSNLVNELQLENATMRNNLGIPVNEKISTHGILKKYHDLEMANTELTNKLLEYENKFISLEIDNHDKKSELQQLKSLVQTANVNVSNGVYYEKTTSSTLESILEENEGLRNGLAEILTFIKDNSKTTSGVLSMECPSLEAILNSMEARKLAGWFSPHMKTVMELKAAVGGKDALMDALHESRKETFHIMKKLAEEEQKSSGLEKVILDIKEKSNLKSETNDKISNAADISEGEFGSWISNNAYGNLDFNDDNQLQDILTKGNILYKNQFVHALKYFQNKFTVLFDKFTSLTITAEDNLNGWVVKEEQYKAEIENLKCQIDENEDDTSSRSAGLFTSSKSIFMDRKYNFLENSYKQIRTLSENIKNEYLESKKERMAESFEYEKKVQCLITSVLNLSDKLRNSIPVELFLKQNEVLNQYIIKYRNIVEINNKKHIQTLDIIKRLDEDKLEIINRFHKETTTNKDPKTNKISDVEKLVTQKQLEQISLELNKKNFEIDTLEKKVLDLQTSQSLLIDKTMHIETIEEMHIIEDQMKLLKEENKFLKDQQKDIQNKHDILLLQLKAYEQEKLNNDIEINMLRHQILDLQSMGDNKAIIARLSGEVLLAQVQTSESYEKIESLKIDLHREKQLRAETEETLNTHQKVFDIFSTRCNKQFRTMNNIVEILRNQYVGGLPLISAESFFNRLKEVQGKSQEIEKKLNDIEDLRLNLMTKHSIYSQILDLSKTKCFEDEYSCSHKLENVIMEKTQKLEIENYDKKILLLEQSHKNLLERCDLLERTLVLVSQGFKTINAKFENPMNYIETREIEVQDIQNSDETISKGSLTYTVPHDKPQYIDLKDGKTKYGISDANIPNKTVSKSKQVEHHQTQTDLNSRTTDVKLVQTEDDKKAVELNSHINKLLCDNRQKEKLLGEINIRSDQQAQDLLLLNTKNNELNNKLQSLFNTISEKEKTIENLEVIINSGKKEINYFKMKESAQTNTNDTVNAENQVLLANLKKIENDKNDVIVEYKELLSKERQEYLKSIKNLQSKLLELQTVVDEKQSKAISANDDVGKETTSKYTLKNSDLEDKCFKLQSDLEGYKTDLKNQQSELERWKELAMDRLSKMELLSAQLKERHNHEMESYKAENQHWLSQLNETQREHMELRTRLTEQKSFHVKQLAEKDAHIEHLRSVINNLKTQVLSMQTMLTINDPSFDLSAIVEVDEVSDAASQQGSDRLELKFESSGDLNEVQDDFVRVPSSSTAIWQEPLIERLRREKQLVGKQNAILRRQIKALAARERRSRLDAQNLKNQIFRITTTGNKVPSAESAALQNKIQSLQAQLTSARRDAHSSVALWDKWKRAQQTAERWQAKFEEKCQEIKKIEMSLNLAKSAIARLEKEKRALLARLSDMKHEKSLTIEKQDAEESEKALVRNEDCYTPPPVSTRALLDRVESQQRRIAALELAEMGNETLVSEYERCLAEITSLKGQVLKLESTLLEAQIRSPLKSTDDAKPELDYWKNYCDMLKEENMQLTLRVTSLENVPTSAHHQRVSDLEQTVLTLRGLVSKLQADQKSSVGAHRRVDSRPNSGRSSSEKIRSQVESYRIEISNLKKSIVEKDNLLETSKEMLKIAAEREDDLLRENALLQRRLEQLEIKRGVMSA